MSSDIKRRLRDAEVGEAFQTEDGSPELQRTALGQEAAARIEALEGENADANLIAKEQTQLAINAKLALAEADARAERLRVALEEISAGGADRWDGKWCAHLARKALSEDKQ
jgi:hypothetical protein